MAGGTSAGIVVTGGVGMGAPAGPAGAVDGRPTAPLPDLQLVRLSLYWLGLTAVMAGVTQILAGRLQYEGLVPAGTEGDALFRMTALGAVVAMVVQPTVGTISDYTISRWGRRKPYIVIGTLLDLVFLVGIASSNTVLAIAVFMILLQLSSNFAQGPFQGYVPDLVPAPQVGPRLVARRPLQRPRQRRRDRDRRARRHARRGPPERLLRGDDQPRDPRARDDGQRRRPRRRRASAPRPCRALLAGRRPGGVGRRHPPRAELPLPRRVALLRPHGRRRPLQRRDLLRRPEPRASTAARAGSPCSRCSPS